MNEDRWRRSMHGVGSFKDGIGAALGSLRSKAGLSQTALAKLVGRKIQPRLSQVERGEVVPSGQLIDEYLTFSHADVDDLGDAFLGEEPSEEILVRRALRALRLGTLPPRLEELALQQLQTQRRTLREALGYPPEDEEISS